MRDLDLLNEYLIRLRQQKLKEAHSWLLDNYPPLAKVQAVAHEAEICNRIQEAVKVLAKDPGQFLKEFLP